MEVSLDGPGGGKGLDSEVEINDNHFDSGGGGEPPMICGRKIRKPEDGEKVYLYDGCLNGRDAPLLRPSAKTVSVALC